jgi:hypothetical protein
MIMIYMNYLSDIDKHPNHLTCIVLLRLGVSWL